VEIKLHIKAGQGRQGDVFVVPASRPFEDSDLGEPILEQSGNRVVLAHGEVTGHAHAFYPEQDVAEGLAEPVVSPVRLFPLHNADKYAPTAFKEARALRLKVRAFLRHEEHTIHSFPAGDYVVIQQHEGDELNELRRVAD